MYRYTHIYLLYIYDHISLYKLYILIYHCINYTIIYIYMHICIYVHMNLFKIQVCAYIEQFHQFGTSSCTFRSLRSLKPNSAHRAAEESWSPRWSGCFVDFIYSYGHLLSHLSIHNIYYPIFFAFIIPFDLSIYPSS